jgi:hypothetical protein
MAVLNTSSTPIRGADVAISQARLSHVRIELSDQTLELRLAWWERAFGLMRSIRVARADVSEVEYVEDPMRLAMRSGLKAGLRLPWVLFVARTLRLDQAFIVRRRQPGLSFAVANHAPLQRVLVSTPEAAALARALGGRASPGA